jgi:hypothetical protein
MKNLYSKIENEIIKWVNDGTKTAGTLTRKLNKIYQKELKKMNNNELKEYELNSISTSDGVLQFEMFTTKKEHALLYGFSIDNPIFINGLCNTTVFKKKDEYDYLKLNELIKLYTHKNKSEFVFGNIKYKTDYENEICLEFCEKANYQYRQNVKGYLDIWKFL